jgi:hypothetical protein
MYATYRREYKTFTHLPGESIDFFQRFTVVVNNMMANVDLFPYDYHDRAVLMVETCNNLRPASIRTYTFFHHGVTPKVLVNPRSKGIANA